MRKFLCLLAMLFLVGDANSHPVSGADVNQHKAGASDPQGGHAKAPAPPSFGIQPAMRELPTEDRSDQNKEGGKPGGLSAWFARLFEDPIAIFTLVVAVYTTLLYRATAKLADGANDTAIRQLRAYVSIQPGNGDLNDTIPPRLEYTVHNYGHTPAHNVGISSAWLLRESHLPQIFPPFGEILGTSPRNVLMPRADFAGEEMFARRLTAEELDRIRVHHTHKLYLWGKVIYEDSFGIARETVFRWEFSASPSGRMRIAICHEGNKAT